MVYIFDNIRTSDSGEGAGCLLSIDVWGRMTTPRPYSRHGLNAPMARIKLRGFGTIDRRTAAAREQLALRRELANALRGESDLSPQRRKLIDMAARASLLLDHVDAWLFRQRSLVNARAKTLLPVLVQRQALADHLVRLLDKLGLDRLPQKVGPTSIGGTAVIYIPDNGRDAFAAVGGTTNGSHPAHRSPESESPTEIATVELPPRDASDVISPNGDQRHDDNERDP